MNRFMLLCGLAVVAVGCNASVKGTVVDGMSGEPINGAGGDAGDAMRLIATAVTDNGGKLEENPSAGLTCMALTSDVAADGGFNLEGLCTSATAYKLELTDKNLLLGETDMLEQGFAGDSVQIKVWRTPSAGVFKLTGKDLERIGSGVDLRSDQIYTTEEQVLSPKTIPSNVPLIGEGEHLVLAGQSNANLQLVPLVNSGPRKLGNEEKWADQGAWAYVGTAFTTDSEFERKTASPDAAKVVKVEKRDNLARFVKHDAVPAGRYMVMAEGADRGFVVDFGSAGQMPNEEFPEAEGEAG